MDRRKAAAWAMHPSSTVSCDDAVRTPHDEPECAASKGTRSNPSLPSGEVRAHGPTPPGVAPRSGGWPRRTPRPEPRRQTEHLIRCRAGAHLALPTATTPDSSLWTSCRALASAVVHACGDSSWTLPAESSAEYAPILAPPMHPCCPYWFGRLRRPEHPGLGSRRLATGRT